MSPFHFFDFQVILSTWRKNGGLVVERMAVALEGVNQQARLLDKIV